MLPAEQPVKAERGSGCSIYEVASQVCLPVEGRFALSVSKSTTSILIWTPAGAPDKHRASLQTSKELTGAAACVSATMRQAQALQAIMQQPGKRDWNLAPSMSRLQGRTFAYRFQQRPSTPHTLPLLDFPSYLKWEALAEECGMLLASPPFRKPRHCMQAGPCS